MTTCPCCGAPMREPPTLAQLQAIGMGGLGARLIDELVRFYPRPRTYAQLADSIYADDPQGGPLTARNSLAVTASRVRRLIEPMGWTISRVGRHDGVVLVPMHGKGMTRQ